MDVRVLGQVEARSDAHRYELGGPRQRRLFAALVARRGEVVDVSVLVDVCWPGGRAPGRAEHNVRTYVHRLRGAMNDDGTRIETVGTGYRLHTERDEVDLDRLDDLARRAARALSTGDAVAALDAIEEADRLWQGRPYGEFADEPWAIAEAAHFDEVRIALDEHRAEALLTAGRAGEAVARLERLIAQHPLRERPRALLMRALYESGRPAEALRAFQVFRRYLIDESGVEPSRDLVDLDRRIADGTFAGTPSARRVGSYELHERIGEGAFAVVHRATQSSLGREVAVKIIRAEFADRPEFIRRFEAEAQMVASIEHPNVVPLYDYWREPGQAFLVMRWMTGGSLEQRLDAGPWTLDDTLRLVDGVAAALDAAHTRGIVHRDVKPANILFDDDGVAYLGDFGIALAAEERSTPRAALSEGSPIYASPEQLRREPVGPEADVHALGIVTYTALTGHTPFEDAANDAEMLRRQLVDPIPPITSRRPDLPVGLDGVIATATAKRPADRYPTARGFATALRSAASRTVATPITSTLDRSNPYLGLRPFTEADVSVFHGRTRVVRELLDACADRDHRLLAVVGPSGSGKSSVVRAGLVPALRANGIAGSGDWFVTTMIPGRHPYEALETALLRVATNPPAALLEQLRDGDRGIHRAAARIVPDDGGTVLVVIDQFEELFTATDDAERQRFLRALAVAVSEPGGPLHVVATMRADFYDQPLRHPQFAPLFKQATVAITPLAPDELEEAITTPAAAVGVAFEPGLIAEIVADVNSQPGALPLLQYALTQTFEARDGDTLTTGTYRRIGGLTGALAQRADDLYRGSTDRQQASVRRLLGRLVTLGEGTEDTRRRVRRSELTDDAATERVIEAFGEARLLTFDRDPTTREPTVEIAHEALIREWPRLRRWLDEDRDDLRIHRHLTETSNAWTASGRDDGELYRGARLDAAASWASAHGPDLNPTEQEFLGTSIAAHQAEEVAEQERFEEQVRANRRLRALAAIATVIALIAAGVGVFALQQRSRAEDSASDARRQAAAARAAEEQADLERIRAVALATAAQDPSTAALLAVEAHRLDPSVESLDALQRVLTEIPGYHGSIGGTPYLGMVAIDDGTVAATRGDAIDVWDLSSRELIRSIPHAGPGGPAIMASVGSSRLAVVDAGRTSTTVFDIETGEAVASIDHDEAVGDIAATADGTRLAAGLLGGDVEVWTIGSDAGPGFVVDTPDVDVSFVRWHPDGERLAVVLGNAVVQLWEPGTDAPAWATEPPQAGIVNQLNPFAVAFDPSGERLAWIAGSLGTSLRIVDVSSGGEARPAIPLPTIGHFVVDDIEWRDANTIVVPSRGSVGSVDLASGLVEIEIEQFIRAGFSAHFSTALGQYVIGGLSGLEFWSSDPSGPLERRIELTPEQDAALAAGGGPILSALSSDGSRLIVSVFKVPAPLPPTTMVGLGTEDPTVTAADELGVVIGYGDLTLHAREDFTLEILDRDLDAMGPPIPLPFDYTELGVSEDGRFLALGRLGGLADVYRIGDGTLVGTVALGDATEFAGAQVGPWFTRDGEFMTLTTTDGRAGIWRTEPLERIDPPEELSTGLVVALGDWLFAQQGAAVQRWDPRTLRPVGVPIPLAGLGALGYARFDAANQRIVAGGTEVAKVFDLETGRQLGRDLPYAGGANRLQFTADGSILSVPADGAVGVWNLDTDTWPDIACRFAGRNLTADEWDQVGPRTVEYRATCERYPIEM